MLTPRSSAFSSCSSVRCSDWTSITGSPLGIAAFPAQRDRAPGTRRMSTGEPSSKAPEYPGDLAENRDVRCVDRLERVVLRLQPHALVLAEEALHRRLVRRFVVSDERQRMQLAVGPELNRLGGGAAVLQQLERAWLGRIAAKVARAFQIREVRMDGRRRG